MLSVPMVLGGAWFAWYMATTYVSPLKLAFGATCLTLYGGLLAIAVSYDGGRLGEPQFLFAGQLLLLFFSVVGGALFSMALSEIRQKAMSSKN
tara:strand:+ start:930 stop:1208 length:279 start_codon:yes stop_codon:yes gene_type:complete